MDFVVPPIETERLVLRVPTSRDAEAMCRFVTDNREHLAPWEPLRDEAYFTVEFWSQELCRRRTEFEAGRVLQFVLTERGQVSNGSIMGQVTVSGISRGPFQAAYLGYALDHRAVGEGLMTEALRALVAFCFDGLNLHRLMANYMPDNERSARVLDRLGFEREGFARDYLYLAGAWQDHILTALTNPDWKANGLDGDRPNADAGRP